MITSVKVYNLSQEFGFVFFYIKHNQNLIFACTFIWHMITLIIITVKPAGGHARLMAASLLGIEYVVKAVGLPECCGNEQRRVLSQRVYLQRSHTSLF